ncbi:MAG: hypothetical protein BEN19_02750 [Epulopiscium sp. Nuni2H_MBin003]|nr:MAG: hypothetical protein BEN19_02750 [Epulopiscium sp. Nuni2H_MBin003]
MYNNMYPVYTEDEPNYYTTEKYAESVNNFYGEPIPRPYPTQMPDGYGEPIPRPYPTQHVCMVCGCRPCRCQLYASSVNVCNDCCCKPMPVGPCKPPKPCGCNKPPKPCGCNKPCECKPKKKCKCTCKCTCN